MHIKRLVGYVSIAAIVVAGAGVVYVKSYLPAHTFETRKATRGDLNVTVGGIGTVDAKSIYTVNAGVASEIVALYADEGATVKKDALLAELDTHELPLQMQERKAAVQKARYALTAKQKALDALKVQKHFADATLQRYRMLKRKSEVSQADFDKAMQAVEVLEATIASAKADLEAAKMEVTRSQKSVASLERVLQQYKRYAPVDGFVVRRDASVGEQMVPTAPVFKIVSPKDVWIKAYVDERVAGTLKEGNIAQIKLRSYPKRVFEGRVARIRLESDPVTEEREVDVAFADVPVPFYLNEQAEVTIVTDMLHHVIEVPNRALDHHGKQTGIWIKKEGKAHFLPLEIIAHGAVRSAVEGVEEDAVILLPKARMPLKEGMRVYP